VIRINLIPPEILQSRKDEARWKWVWLGAGVVALLVAMWWGVLYIQVASSTSDVASIQQQAASEQAQASRFEIFKQQESDLSVRKAAVAAAIKDRINWAKMLYELGLVLPNDVYLTTFTGTDNGGSGTGDSVVTMAGEAVDEPDDSPNNGYKSVARMLVRLSDLQQLDSVWLTSMSLGEGSDTEAPMISWAVNARVTASTATTSTND
jgi:Tfp pilus assembly protein PilN